MVFLFSVAAKVAYSLPSHDHFNNSLIESDTDPIGPDYMVRTVVLDAGHGGKDPGCLGKKTTEKEIALDVVLKLGQMIKSSYPDVKVVYTRDTDEFIPLHERAQIANNHEADLFISVHCNATVKKSVSGSETFVLGLHRAADNLEVAKRENAAILKEENYQQNYDGFDPNSDEGHIALSMYQNAFLDQSIAFATLVEGEFVDYAGRESRGVKQAGFLVLRNTYMPSVLVEAGFLTNTKEENFLVTEDGKLRTAKSIFNAFSKYKYDIESYASQQVVNATAPAKERVVEEHVVNQQIVETPVTEKPVVVHEEVAAKPIVTNSTSVQASTKQTAPTHRKSHTGATIRVSAQQPSTTRVVRESTVSSPAHTKPEQSKTTSPAVTYVQQSDVEYVVQIAAGTKKLRPTSSKWQKLDDVLIRFENGMYKYQVGGLKSMHMANQKKTYLRGIGFSDCFIVAYRDGKPVRLTDVAVVGSR